MSKEADELLNEVAHYKWERLMGGTWMADFHWHNARRLAAAIIGRGV